MRHIKKIIVYWSIVLIGEGRSLIPQKNTKVSQRELKKRAISKKGEKAIAWRSQRELKKREVKKRENSNSLKKPARIEKARIEKARSERKREEARKEASENWKRELKSEKIASENWRSHSLKNWKRRKFYQLWLF